MSQQAPPLEEAQNILERFQLAEKQLKSLQKFLREVVDSFHDLRKVKQKVDQIQAINRDFPSADLHLCVEGLCQNLTAWASQEERARPLRFGRELREAAAAQGIACEPLTSDPPMLRLAPFTVELQHGRGQARLEYARNVLADCPLDTAQILQAHQRLLAELDTPFEPESYLEKIFRAYRRRLEICQLSAADRVELVDIHADLTMLLQPEEFHRDPTKDNFRPYGKARFAYDLARLRHSGKLDYKGFRLTLGTATVGTTRDKSRVIYLEEGHKGQYFLTIWFSGTKM